jgi:alpha-glucosidase
MMISDTDAGLVTNDMVFLLSRSLQIENPRWIKSGKVAWDWWNANNIYGVDFESGINNDTYKFYIDFAAEFKLDYIILDEGWSMTSTNICENSPYIDVEELVRYGDRKNVGVILWTLWKPLDRDMEKVLDLYKKWGVKGIKVDFMQRSDQYMVNFYERVAREAAKRALLVDFHGAFKPSGLRRAYPNVVSYEGVKGMEQLKWSDTNTPEHNLMLPFIRMAAGPMDYTPGAMQNAHPEHFMDRFTNPMSIGTRCHQAAMYVVYESPLQMLADNPSNYLKERTTTEFISKIPTTWDETIVLEANIGDYILLARRNGENWYVAALNDENPRTLDLDLSFLPEGNYVAEIMRDGVNANKIAIDFKHLTETVQNKYTRKIRLARGGGWAAILRPLKQ